MAPKKAPDPAPLTAVDRERLVAQVVAEAEAQSEAVPEGVGSAPMPAVDLPEIIAIVVDVLGPQLGKPFDKAALVRLAFNLFVRLRPMFKAKAALDAE